MEFPPTIAEHAPSTSFEVKREVKREVGRVAAYSTEIVRETLDRAQAYFRRGIAYMVQSRSRGHDYFGDSDLDKAISDFTRATELGLRDALLFAHRGACHHVNGNLISDEKFHPILGKAADMGFIE